MVNELRVGNYVRHGVGWSYRSQPDDVSLRIFQWTEYDFYALHECTLDEDLIIPLCITEDILLQFGFISNPYQDTYNKDGFVLDSDKTMGKMVLHYRETEIRYIHRLQNLYFEIKNQELGALRLK
jgi:hypothetical protein